MEESFQQGPLAGNNCRRGFQLIFPFPVLMTRGFHSRNIARECPTPVTLKVRGLKGSIAALGRTRLPRTYYWPGYHWLVSIPSPQLLLFDYSLAGGAADCSEPWTERLVSSNSS